MFGLGVALASAMLAASGANGSAACGQDEVAWRGGCFHRYQWDIDEQACPDGVILLPEGADRPRCTPCTGYAGMQQPMNYCAGLLARQTDASLKEAFEDVVKRLPDREAELRDTQTVWVRARDKTCRAREKAFEGGSMAPQVHGNCIARKNRKRITELREMGRPSTGGATATPRPR